mmetsp:Transcript_71804/g.136649  ORF Transcript_71804/g.136649 Transcript_71804/m.136649 type:complete len:313 (-) Transcript_71804:240-1178(-)
MLMRRASVLPGLPARVLPRQRCLFLHRQQRCRVHQQWPKTWRRPFSSEARWKLMSPSQMHPMPPLSPEPGQPARAEGGLPGPWMDIMRPLAMDATLGHLTAPLPTLDLASCTVAAVLRWHRPTPMASGTSPWRPPARSLRIFNLKMELSCHRWRLLSCLCWELPCWRTATSRCPLLRWRGLPLAPARRAAAAPWADRPPVCLQLLCWCQLQRETMHHHTGIPLNRAQMRLLRTRMQPISVLGLSAEGLTSGRIETVSRSVPSAWCKPWNRSGRIPFGARVLNPVLLVQPERVLRLRHGRIERPMLSATPRAS